MVDGSCCAITVAGLLDRFSCGVDERQRMCVAIADDVRTHAAQPPAIEELSTCQLAMKHSLCISRVGRSVWQPTRLQLYKLGRHDLLLLLLLLVMNRLLPLLRILHKTKTTQKYPESYLFGSVGAILLAPQSLETASARDWWPLQLTNQGRI